MLTTQEKHLLGQEVTRFDKQIQSLYGIKPAVYWIDNRTEYCLFWEYCKDMGTTIETSAPHALEQDGIAERHIGILLQMTRVMLLSSDLLKFLWPEAYKVATYILN